MRKHIWRLVDLLALALIALAAVVSLTGCFAIPVRAVPTDEPILVAPVGVEHQQEDGSVALNPELPQPDAKKFPPAPSVTAGWGTLLSIALQILGVVSTGGLAALLPKLGKLGAVAKIACELADQNAAAETDDQVAVNKAKALAKQREAGVVTLTSKIRGK